MLRLCLLFLFWILREDEVRGWRLTTSFLLDPRQIPWKLPRGNQFLMVEDHLRRGLGKLRLSACPQVSQLRTCLSFTLKDIVVVLLLGGHTALAPTLHTPAKGYFLESYK